MKVLSYFELRQCPIIANAGTRHSLGLRGVLREVSGQPGELVVAESWMRQLAGAAGK
jgi:hypothetical protein